MEKVFVDQDKCIGCGACIGTLPDVFDFNEDGLSQVINDKVTDDVKDLIKNQVCPVDAIEIKEK